MQQGSCLATSFLILFAAGTVLALFITNMNDKCMHCLCKAATGCNLKTGCHQGYCGPFGISRIYWTDAGKHVLPHDDAHREKAYSDCAKEFNCAKQIVLDYMTKYGRDCNQDGVTDCSDYASIHYNGGYSCEESTEGTEFSSIFKECMHQGHLHDTHLDDLVEK